MQLFVGTSGYSYKEWKGSFYPEKLPAGEMLRFYAQHFNTVEINNTFYRMPDETVLARWAETVPEGFAFAVKAPRRITHDRRLHGVEPDVAEFLRRAAVLGAKLGPLLFQTPPFLKMELARLETFLASIPADLQIAFEFRNETWMVEPVYDILRKRNAMLCIADTDEGDTPLVATGNVGYLRLRRTQYTDGELATWAARIAAQPWERVYIYFKHEDEGWGVKFAQRFLALWPQKT